MTKAQKRNKYLQTKYGITALQYQLMLNRQGGGCAICYALPKKTRLHVDHCHKTGRVRGLLCYYCNRRRVGRSRAEHAVYHTRVAAYLVSTFDGRELL